jgi:hypothetical protein
MENWFSLLQTGMNSVRARQALLGTNRALNRSQDYLENLVEDPFTPEELAQIDQVYARIPVWKRKLDLLDLMLDEPPDFQEVLVFTDDFNRLMKEIDSEMTALAKVLKKSRH